MSSFSEQTYLEAKEHRSVNKRMLMQRTQYFNRKCNFSRLVALFALDWQYDCFKASLHKKAVINE